MKKIILFVLCFSFINLLFGLDNKLSNNYFIEMDLDTPVYAIDDGEFLSHGYDNILGNYIEIKYGKLGIIVKYCNLHKFNYFLNGKIPKGSQIGSSGVTGFIETPGLTIIITIQEDFYIMNKEEY